MGIQLNIKSKEARELAEEVAALSGESLTEAVINALRRRKLELTREERFARVMAMVEGLRERWPKEILEAEDPTAFLYDENGLPA